MPFSFSMSALFSSCTAVSTRLFCSGARLVTAVELSEPYPSRIDNERNFNSPCARTLSRKRWSKEEVERLLGMRRQSVPWSEIRLSFPNRSASSLHTQLGYLGAGSSKNLWSAAEDELLNRLKVVDRRSWAEISRAVRAIISRLPCCLRRLLMAKRASTDASPHYEFHKRKILRHLVACSRTRTCPNALSEVAVVLRRGSPACLPTRPAKTIMEGNRPVLECVAYCRNHKIQNGTLGASEIGWVHKFAGDV